MATKRKTAAKRGPAKKAGAKGGAKRGGKVWYPAGPAPTTAGRGRRKPTAPKKAAPKKGAPRKGAAAPRAAPAAALPDTARPLALAIAKAALAKKAEEVLLLDVRGLTSYADYFVVMTADSERQAGAVADHVDEEMKKAGHTKVGVEGYEAGRWILVDYGDVVAHVMSKEAREFYDIEGLWADAPRTALQD